MIPALVRDLEGRGLLDGAPVFLRIFKEERQLELWLEKGRVFSLFRTWDIAALSGELGPKLKEGDKQAPEGFYSVARSGMNPQSRFHLAFNLGFPNSYDRAHGRTGSALMVHGGEESSGCFAMTDAKMEEIYALADAALGQGQLFFQVHCFPFRMTPERMREHAGSVWIEFWRNLKIGYDFFEETRQLPVVKARDGKYVVTNVAEH